MVALAIQDNNSFDVDPWFWSGLIDAEGSFSIIIDKNNTRKLGWLLKLFNLNFKWVYINGL